MEFNFNHGIYKITCLANSKIYIGSAVNLQYRMKSHLLHLKNGTHKNKHLQSAFDLYGKNKFIFDVIEYVDKKEDLLIREQYWMDELRPYDNSIGFNICKVAGSSLGIKRSPEFKEKIRLCNQNRSKELKDKVSESIRKANTGRVAWNKGTKVPLEARRKPCLGKKFPNRKFTPEGYAKICESNRKPRGEDYIAKRSFISSKAYYMVSPEGANIKIENMKQFCINIGLNCAHMYQVAKGNIMQHKGWSRDKDCY